MNKSIVSLRTISINSKLTPDTRSHDVNSWQRANDITLYAILVYVSHDVIDILDSGVEKSNNVFILSWYMYCLNLD
jgi:hypothetical protein